MNTLQISTQHDMTFVSVETVNVNAGLTGLSVHTARAYRRHIGDFLIFANQPYTFDFEALDLDLAIRSLSPANLKAFLGRMKSVNLGRQSITQAKAAIVWLAQFLADLGRVPYFMPAALSKVKAPRAEIGQRPGKWLSHDEIALLLTAKPLRVSSSPLVARNRAIIILLAICGLRRDELCTATWADLTITGGRNVLRVHGKGEKLRLVKLPGMAMRALEAWRQVHPCPDDTAPIFTQVLKGGRKTRRGLTDRAIWCVVLETAQAAGLGRISPHDLRRSFARGSYEVGVPMELIRQVLGHSSIATTERYINAKLELDEAATDLFAATFNVE